MIKNLKNGLKMGLSITRIMYLGVILGSCILGGLYKLTLNGIFIYALILGAVLIAMMLIVSTPRMFIEIKKDLSVLGGVIVLLVSFFIVISAMAILMFLINVFYFEYAQSWEVINIPYVLSSSIIIGHFIAFIVLFES